MLHEYFHEFAPLPLSFLVYTFTSEVIALLANFSLLIRRIVNI